MRIPACIHCKSGQGARIMRIRQENPGANTGLRPGPAQALSRFGTETRRGQRSLSPLCRYTAANPAVVFLKQGMAVRDAVAPAVLLWYPQPGRPSTVSRGYARSCCERLNGGKGYAGSSRAPAAALSKALRLSRAFHLCQPVYSGTFQTQIRFTC